MKFIFPNSETRLGYMDNIALGHKIFIVSGEFATDGNPYIVAEIKHIMSDKKNKRLVSEYTHVILERHREIRI